MKPHDRDPWFLMLAAVCAACHNKRVFLMLGATVMIERQEKATAVHASVKAAHGSATLVQELVLASDCVLHVKGGCPSLHLKI